MWHNLIYFGQLVKFLRVQKVYYLVTSTLYELGNLVFSVIILRSFPFKWFHHYRYLLFIILVNLYSIRMIWVWLRSFLFLFVTAVKQYKINNTAFNDNSKRSDNSPFKLILSRTVRDVQIVLETRSQTRQS